LEKQGAAGTPDATHTEERWIIQLAAMDRTTNPGFITLLFLGIDKERAEAVYGDINTLNLRTAKKGPNEGGAVSAHLVIDLTSTVGVNGHSAILEDAEGLSRSRIMPYLRWLLAKFVMFQERNKDGKDENVVPNIAGDVVLDRPIGEQLNTAQLVAVDVFKKAKTSTIDKSLEYYEKTRLIQYKPISSAKGAAAAKIISTILAGAPREEYPEVRVRIKEPDGTERSVAADRHKEDDALLSAFQLRTLIENLNPAVDEATKTIANHMASAMIEAFPNKLTKSSKAGG
jgi:hypothetical protein